MTHPQPLPIGRPEPQRCACPACLALDKRWPADGWQLQLPTVETSRRLDILEPRP